MAKPVTIDFLANNRQLLRAVKEAETSLGGLQSQIARTNAAQATLGKSGDWPALNKAIRDATQQMAGYESQINRGAAASQKLAASNERWVKGAIVGAKVGAAGVAGLALALGGAATRAVSFDAAMRNVNSIAGLSQKQFKLLEGQVLRLAPAVGSSTTDLAKGLYDIVSTGFKANDAIKVLTVSAKAGKAGLTDTATATDAITSALKAYGQGAGQARAVSDLMFQTVNVGKLNFDQLAKSIGTVLPSAASLGIPLKELGAAMATITLNGTNANEASTQLSSIFTAFQKPTKDLTKVFKDQGFETAALGLKQLGLKGALELLQKQVGGGHATWTDFFKDVRALRGAQGLEGTANAVKLFNSSTKAMDDALKGVGATQKAFNEQSKSTSVQFDKLKATIDVAAVTIGTALLPELNKGISALSEWLAQAQKSGELQHFAQTIAHDVEATVKWLESLGPAAEKGLHAATATFHTAISVSKALLDIVEAISPELEAVAGASAHVVGALGSGPIVGAGLAYLGLNRALLTAQAGMGKFASVMKAGSEATARAGGGAVLAGGKIDAVGRAAIAAESNVKIAARGITSSFGPQLVAVGVAGIVLSLVALHNSLTDIDKEAQKAADGLLHLNDVRLGRQNAALDVKSATIAKAKALSASGASAVAVVNARADVEASQGHPGAVADPAALRAYNAALAKHKDDAIGAAQADIRLQQAQGVLGQKTTELNKAAGEQAKLFASSAHQADVSAKAEVAGLRQAEIQQGRTNVATATAGRVAEIWGDKLVENAKKADGATAASIRQAQGVAALARELGHVPTPKEQTIIVNGFKAGRTVAEVRAAVLAYEKLHPVVKLDANGKPAIDKMADVTRRATAIDALRPRVHLGSTGFNAVQSGLDAINQNILHLTGNPFTVKVRYAATGGGKDGNPFTPAATGLRIAGAYGTDDVHIRVTGSEVVLNPTQIGMVDSGRYSVMGALNATGAPTIRRGGGYAKGGKPAKPKDLQFKAFPVEVYNDRETNAKTPLDHDRTLLKHLRKERVGLQQDLRDATRKVSEASTPAAKRSAQKRSDDLERKNGLRINTLLPQEAAASQRIEAETTTYQRASRVAKSARGFAASIKRQQDLASQANSEMQLASDRWAQAKTPADKAAQIAAYLAAQKRRSAANNSLAGLLGQAKNAIGDPNSQYFRDTQASITAAEIDETGNIDPSAVPGFSSPDGSPAYLTPEQQYQRDRALLTDANGNPVDPGTAKYLLGLELANQEAQQAAAAGAGNFDLASQITQDEANVRSQLASLSAPASGGGATTQDPDVAAQLAQSQSQVLALTRGRGYGAAAENAFDQGGLMFAVLGDGRSVKALADTTVKGFNASPFIASNAGSLIV